MWTGFKSACRNPYVCLVHLQRGNACAGGLGHQRSRNRKRRHGRHKGPARPPALCLQPLHGSVGGRRQCATMPAGQGEPPPLPTRHPPTATPQPPRHAQGRLTAPRCARCPCPRMSLQSCRRRSLPGRKGRPRFGASPSPPAPAAAREPLRCTNPSAQRRHLGADYQRCR